MIHFIAKSGGVAAVVKVPDGAIMHKVADAIDEEMSNWGERAPAASGGVAVDQFISEEVYEHAINCGTPCIVLGLEVL